MRRDAGRLAGHRASSAWRQPSAHSITQGARACMSSTLRAITTRDIIALGEHHDRREGEPDRRDRPRTPTRGALPLVGGEWQHQHHNACQQRCADDDVGFQRPRDQRQDSEVGEEVPVGAGIRLDHRRVRRLVELARPHHDRQQQDDPDDHDRDDGIFPDRIGEEGLAFLAQDPVVLPPIGGATHRLPRHRRLGDAVLDDQVEMDADQPEEERGDQEGTVTLSFG